MTTRFSESCNFIVKTNASLKAERNTNQPSFDHVEVVSSYPAVFIVH